MLIAKTFHDIPSKLSPNGSPNRIYVIAPKIPGYPKAKFPGVVVFRFVWASCPLLHPIAEKKGRIDLLVDIVRYIR